MDIAKSTRPRWRKRWTTFSCFLFYFAVRLTCSLHLLSRSLCSELSEAQFRHNLSQYLNVATRIPLISSCFMQLSSLIRKSLGNVGSVVLSKAVESTKINLLGQLKLCIPILMRLAVLLDTSNVQTQPMKKRKGGRKTKEDQSEYNAMVNMTALGLFTDSHLRSMRRYLHDPRDEVPTTLIEKISWIGGTTSTPVGGWSTTWSTADCKGYKYHPMTILSRR